MEGRYDEVIERLVKKYKANIDIKNAAGQTPLQILMDAPFITSEAMRLVRFCANPDTQILHYKISLLHILVKNNKNGRNDAAIEELVRKHKANVNIEHAEGKTPLQELFCNKPDPRYVIYPVV